MGLPLIILSCDNFVEAGILVVPHQFVVDAQLPDLFVVDGTLFEVMTQQLEDGRLVVAVTRPWVVVLLEVLQCVFEIINGIIVSFDHCALGTECPLVIGVDPPSCLLCQQEGLLWCFEDMPRVGVELDVAVVACQRASSRNRIDHGCELMSFELGVCDGATVAYRETFEFGDCKSPSRLRSDYKSARTGAELSGKSGGAWGDFVIGSISF